MDFKKERTIVLLSRVQGVVIKGLIRKLADHDFKVIFVGNDMEELRKTEAIADIFVIYLDGDMDELEECIRYISAFTMNTEQEIITIGEKRDHEGFRTRYPAIDPMKSFERPVDPEEFLKVIGKYYYDRVMQAVKKNIMILDDDALYAKMVRDWLKDDYKVIVSTTPLQGINYLVSHPIDLVLLDYEMPVFSGPKVLQMLRSDENTADIPVVFLTGIGSRESVQKVMALKPEGYILKTTTKDQLLEWLRTFFAKKG